MSVWRMETSDDRLELPRVTTDKVALKSRVLAVFVKIQSLKHVPKILSFVVLTV